METKATKIRKQPAISKEMLQKLEVEKQRLLNERLQLKQKEAMERKQRIKEFKDEAMMKMKAHMAKVKIAQEEQERRRLETLKRRVEKKMENAKEIKAEIKLEQLKKNTARKIKHHKALIKKLEAEGKREVTFKKRITKEKFGDDNPASLINGLEFRARLREDEIERLEIEVEKVFYFYIDNISFFNSFRINNLKIHCQFTVVHFDEMRPESGCISSHFGFHCWLGNAKQREMAVALALILQKIN